VPVPLGLEGLPDVEPVEPDGELGDDGLVAGGVDGIVDVGGDAEGVRSAGRSPMRSLPDSVQAVSRPAPSASAQKPVSSLFIVKASSLWGLRVTTTEGCNGDAVRRRLDRVRDNLYQCG
jgi:hypothetical protein